MFRILIILLLTSSLTAQKEDFTWVLGYNFERDTFLDEIGGMDLRFSGNSPEIVKINRPTALASNVAGICHPFSGELLFYSNGYYVNNRLHERMMNGDSLMAIDNLFEVGDVRDQANLILPLPGTDSMYVLIHRKRENLRDTTWNGLHITELFYSIIDLREDGGLGAISEFAIPLFNKYLINGQITACRHGNGRDWWIVCRDWCGQEFYFFLLDPDGVHFHHQESTLVHLPINFGRAEFSPDGRVLGLRVGNRTSGNQLLNLTLYAFDRCTGYIDSLITSFDDKSLGSSECGLAFSPSSQYVYVTTGDSVLQYDVWARDIFRSKKIVGIYDGYVDLFPTYLFKPIYAPNNKIYITVPQAHRVWHTIHAPDSLGAACRLVQHDFDLPRYNFGATHNYPQFRLGPMDGSACDTLGIDNVPGARFRNEGNKKHRWFVDLSYGNPDNWSWTFGDGKTSTERLPVHDYDTSGVYEVCLTVSNQYGQDTWCDSLTIDCLSNSTSRTKDGVQIDIYPNPSRGLLQVEGIDLSKVDIYVTDLTGTPLIFHTKGQHINIEGTGVVFITLKHRDYSIVKKVILMQEQ